MKVLIKKICVVIIFLRVLLKNIGKRNMIFMKEKLEELHYKNIVGEYDSYEVYLYNRIRDKYTQVTINIPIEKQKVREKLGLYTNQRSSNFIAKVLFLASGLIGAIFSALINTNEGLRNISVFIIVALIITVVIDNKRININEAEIKYYSMCLVVLEELELEKLNINKNKEV